MTHLQADQLVMQLRVEEMRERYHYTVSVKDRNVLLPEIGKPDYEVRLTPVKGFMSGIEHILEVVRGVKGHVSIFITNVGGCGLIMV